MYVKFSQDIGSWKNGEIHDLPDAVARSFVSGGMASESNSGDALRASLTSENQKFQRSLMDEVLGAIKAQKTTQGPPSGGGSVQFDKIAAGQQSPERSHDGRDNRSFGDICRCVYFAQSSQVDEGARRHALYRLGKVYGCDHTTSKFDEETGEYSQSTTRTLDSGTIETITRTGTESISGGPTYGFAVKPEWYGQLFEIPVEQQVVVRDAFQVPVGNALEFKWPALDQYKAPTTLGGVIQPAVFAGFQLAYKGEASQRPYSDSALDMIDFKIVDLTGFTTLSRDLIADNYIAMDAMAQRVFARAFQWMEDYMSIQGPGGGKPQGYFNSPAVLTQTRGTASHIYYADLVGMLSKLHPAFWQEARFVANVTTIPELVAIQSSSGTFVYNPNALISQAMRPSVQADSNHERGDNTYKGAGQLLGLPVYFTEKVPALGNQGDLSLVAPSQYGVARRAGLEVGLSEHFLFDTDLLAFRFKMRHDMKGLWRGPYIQADGSSTKVSPFILLK